MDIITMAMANVMAKKYTNDQLETLGLHDMAYHFCTSQEYNHSTGVPTIASPDEYTFYFVPSINNDNLFNVYLYKNSWTIFISVGIDVANIPVDETLSINGAAADAKAVGDEITDLKADLTQFPPIKTPEETEADLYICDVDGNVIAMFADGHIKTKEFDSADINVDVPYTYIHYTKEIDYVTGQSNTAEIAGDWKKGDRIALQIDDGTNGHANKFVQYYADNTSIQEYTTYAYAGMLYEVVLPCNASVLKVVLNGTLWSENKTLVWNIYKFGTIPITPKIVTVAANGGADYTSIRDAIDSLVNPSALVNPYIVEVYKGTYDTIGYYSDEEIATASGGGVDTFMGLTLRDGVSLRGMGTSPEEVVLTSEMDTTKWNATIRGSISTLNREGTNSIENVKIIGKNIRYCVHDDGWSGNSDRHKALVKNCIFVDDGLMTNRTYGMGSKSGQSIVFENCDFGTTGVTYHTNRGGRYPCAARFSDCRGHELGIADYGLAATSMFNELIINNCAFDLITYSESYNEYGLKISGAGSYEAMFKAPYGHVYNLGNVARFPISSWLTPGKVVSLSNLSLTTATYENWYGVCIGSDNDYAYILKYGYLCSEMVGLTGLAVGDYVTVANSVITVGGTQSNAIGIVECVDSSGVAYIRMLGR